MTIGPLALRFLHPLSITYTNYRAIRIHLQELDHGQTDRQAEYLNHFLIILEVFNKNYPKHLRIRNKISRKNQVLKKR